MARRKRDRARHVRDAIVDDAFYLVGRVGVRRRVRGFKTATLIDGDIDNHGAALHRFEHLARDQLGRARARHQDGADHDVGGEDFLLDRFDGGKARAHPAPEQLVEFAQTRDRAVDDGDIRAETRRHPGRMRAYDAATDDRNARRRHAGHAAEQKPASAGVAL